MPNWNVRKVSKVPESKFGINRGKKSKYEELYRMFRRELLHDPKGSFGQDFDTVNEATKAVNSLKSLAETREANDAHKTQFFLRGAAVYAEYKK